MTRTGILIFLFYGTLFLFGIIGEILCIVKFVKSDFEPNYKAELIYGLSAVCGAGAIVGWFDIGEHAEKETETTYEIVYPKDTFQIEPFDTIKIQLDTSL